MKHLNEYWIAAAGIALAVAFPDLASAKSADPIADIIGAKMGWDQPAPHSAPKPVAKSTVSTYDDSWVSWTPERNAQAAVATVSAFRRAERQHVRVAVK
jgi:hypothetical protein